MEKPQDFDAISIQVGSWERRRVKHHKDLVFKCHYKKKKFLWEVLDHTLNVKKKVEFSWDDVDAMSLTEDNDGGSLEILVTKTPSFFCERDLMVKKHPKWHPIEDFTHDHVTPNKLHVLRFEPGVYAKLDKHIKNVANANPDLKKLLLLLPPLEKEDSFIKQIIAYLIHKQGTFIRYPRSQLQHHLLAQSSLPHYNNITASPNSGSSGSNNMLPERDLGQEMQYNNVTNRNNCVPQFIINQGRNPQPQAYHQQPISIVAPSSNPHYQAPSNPNNCHNYANDIINHARDNHPYIRREQQASRHDLLPQLASANADRNGSFISPPMDGSNTVPSSSGSKDGNSLVAQDQIDELYFGAFNL